VGRLLSIVVAAAAAYVILRVGIGMLRMLVAPTPEPPPVGELRRVKLHFRCPVCGLELRVTTAADEDPVPPRHCMDEMELVSTADE
jgi:hypothetical protein